MTTGARQIYGEKKGYDKSGEGRCGMSMADTDKDGRVSRDEHARHCDMMFDKMDTNKDGYIDKDEAAKMRKMHGHRHGNRGYGRAVQLWRRSFRLWRRPPGYGGGRSGYDKSVRVTANMASARATHQSAAYETHGHKINTYYIAVVNLCPQREPLNDAFGGCAHDKRCRATCFLLLIANCDNSALILT